MFMLFIGALLGDKAPLNFDTYVFILADEYGLTWR
jgi:hypothetical protein